MKNKSRNDMSMEKKVALVGIGLAAIYWILESAMHAFLFHKRSLVEQVFAPSPNVLWIRLLVVCVLMMFVAYAQFCIAQRKRAEEANRASAQQWHATFDAISDPICLLDSEGRFLRCNKAMTKLLGKPSSELMGRMCWEVVHGTSEPIEGCPIVRMQESRNRETLVLPIDDRWFNVAVDPVLDEGGDLIGAVHIMSDITERKQADWALGERVKELTCLYEVNRDMQEDLSVDELCRRVIEHLVPAMQFPEITVPLIEVDGRRFTSERHTEGLSHGLHAEIRAGDEARGQLWLYYAEEKSFLIPEEENLISGVAEALGLWLERKRAEEEKEDMQAQLLQSQKMQAIGILASGMAHEFNNLLGAIEGYTELAMEELDEAHPLYSHLRRTSLVAERGASLTRQLIFFARKQPMEATVLNINRTVAHLLEMLKRLIREDIAISTDLAPDLWTVRADEASIEQVIMNLTVNAKEAVLEGGEVTVKTENVTLDEEQCKAIPEARPGKFVCLSVADTGVGMDEETMQRIFEPFFTTKEPGEGAGLGLSVIYGIVKQHEGWIDVHSEPGQGSTFEVYLPALAIKPEGETEEEIS